MIYFAAFVLVTTAIFLSMSQYMYHVHTGNHYGWLDTLYQDKLTTDKKLTVVYSILDEIPTTCFQLCELV